MYIIGNILRRFWALFALFIGIGITTILGMPSGQGWCVGIGIGLVVYFGGLVLLRNISDSNQYYFSIQQKDLPAYGSTETDHSSSNIPAHIPSIEMLLAGEARQWQQRFSSLEWFESIGPHTQTALALHHIRLSNEVLICVAYADIMGTHIGNIAYNNSDLTSRNSVLIATSKRLVLVDPADNIVANIFYIDIDLIQSGAKDNNKKTYT